MRCLTIPPGARIWVLVPSAVLLWMGWSASAQAQTDVEELGRSLGGAVPPPGYYEMLRRDPSAFRFSPDNGWIRRSHAVRARRAAARGAASLTMSFQPSAAVAATDVVAGSVSVPTFLVMYGNTDTALTRQNLPRDSMVRRLYGTQTAPPYSVYSYYREISNDQLTVNGVVYDWTQLPGADTFYEGGSGCNGLCGSAHIASLIAGVVQYWDTLGVDFGQFDNDGPDGVPNSGDDDGFVDAISLIHPEVGGECKAVNAAAQDNIWAHRFHYSGWTGGTPLSTNDASANGGVIKVNDYIIQGGQGGDAVPAGRGGCESNKPQAMGVVAHETGHLFDLPDLYDTQGATAGIGRWGLMGSGNQQVSWRPVHMEAWSRAELGWVTEVMIAHDTTLDIRPIETSDTAYVLPIAGSNEYFLLENRQRIGADSTMIEPGLLIWHADSVLIRQRGGLFTNTVNASFPNGLALEQADGFGNLQQTSGSANRGDTGDPFPGSSNNHEFSYSSNPSSARNDGKPSFVSVDQIDLVPATDVMRARIRFLGSLVAATDTLARIRLDSVEYGRFYGVLAPGDHTVDIDSVQVTNGGRNRYTWLSWSDGGARSHTITISQSADTVLADVAAEFLVKALMSGPGGAVSAAPAAGDFSTGVFLAKGAPLQLTASIATPGTIFEGWSGDTVSSDTMLDLVVNRPYQVIATFAAPLAITTDSLAAAVMGASYQTQLAIEGGLGSASWSLVSGTVPAGMAFSIGGLFAGTPEETGSFPLTVRVVSGSQTQQKAFTLEVAAPAIAVRDVVAQVTGLDTLLSGDELRYLDLLGNRNGQFDVGDFLAWVDAGAQPVSPAVLRAVLAAPKEEGP